MILAKESERFVAGVGAYSEKEARSFRANISVRAMPKLKFLTRDFLSLMENPLVFSSPEFRLADTPGETGESAAAILPIVIEPDCPQKKVVAGSAEAESVDRFGDAMDAAISASIMHEPIVIDLKIFIATSFCMCTVANQGRQTKATRMFQLFGMNGIE